MKKRVKSQGQESRSSNYELLRIVAMFYIVLFHVIKHGNVLEHATGSIAILALFIKCVTLVHVNSFIIISGYFQCKNKFRFSKVWKLSNASLFYKILVIAILSLFDIIAINRLEMIKQFSILNFEQYWFLKLFIFLYCLSPFMNKLINSMKKTEFIKFLLVLSVIMSLIPFVTGLQGFGNDGFTLYNMIYMYFIGAYLRLYPLRESYIFKKCSKQLFQLILIIIFFACVIINIIMLMAGFACKDINDIFGEIYNNIKNLYPLYSNPFVIIQTIAFFCYFGTLNIKKNKFINKVSSLTFGIYLIHDNRFINSNIYKWLKIDRGTIYSCKFILYILLIAVIIFVASAIIEWIRQLLFKFIYKRKLPTKIRNKYNNWLHNLRFIN